MNVDKTKQYLDFMNLYPQHLIEAYLDGFISKIDLNLILDIYFYDYCFHGEKWSQDKSETLSKKLKKDFLDKYDIKFEIIGE